VSGDPLLGCRGCPRLAAHRVAAALHPPRRFRTWVESHRDPGWWIRSVGATPAAPGYWARPVPAFGDPGAPLVVVGLAPAAHGANRTGRMFTGDRSGRFLYAALHRAGLALHDGWERPDDGQRLRGVLLTAACRCAPPGNRPTAAELAACRPWLARDLDREPPPRVLLALGRIAHDAVLAWWRERGGELPRPRPRFAHGAEHTLPRGPALLDSYHVSQQNTFTGRLTEAMFDAVLLRAAGLAGIRDRG